MIFNQINTFSFKKCFLTFQVTRIQWPSVTHIRKNASDFSESVRGGCWGKNLAGITSPTPRSEQFVGVHQATKRIFRVEVQSDCSFLYNSILFNSSINSSSSTKQTSHELLGLSSHTPTDWICSLETKGDPVQIFLSPKGRRYKSWRSVRPRR